MFSKDDDIKDLKTFIQFPGVSSDLSKKAAINDCAGWLYNYLKKTGMQAVQIFPVKPHPAVYAEYIVHPSYQTILFYGHYDVQPVDPLNKWHSLPFKAVVKGDYIYGRGSSDDKGQIFIHIKAVEKLLKARSKLSVNIKFLIEGAEEIGSAGLKDFIQHHASLLKCNVAVVSDTKMISENIPAITYSLRGALNAEVFIQTMNKDLHSGTFGGCVPNAGIALSNFICSLHDQNNTITIPGFYQDVETLSISERNFVKSNGISDENMLHDAESPVSWGEMHYSMYERTTIRPSLSVTGITTGFQGEGVKNVVPSAASVKFNFRLVPKQKPEEIKFLFERLIKQILPGNINVKTVYSSFANPVIVSVNNIYIKAAKSAYEKVFRQKVRLIRSGGTIAAVDFLNGILNIPVVLMGFAQASDNMHAPNEKFYLPNFFRGIETSTEFIKNIASISNKIVSNATHY